MATRSSQPLIVIIGPTASGKTALAIELAREYRGEIICADSRTIYKGMDIGTAKPTIEEQAQVPHWGLDLVEPGERFTAADFKHYAEQKIREIRERGNVPFLVGGTGLYIDGVIFDYQFGSDARLDKRNRLMHCTIAQLLKYCTKNNISLPENLHNKRYIIRAIEQKGINNKRRQEPISSSVIVGISTEPVALRSRIADRNEQLLYNGVVEESIRLGEKYGWESEALTGNIYRLMNLHLQGKLDVEELKIKATILDWRLAKRQLTWFKRNDYIKWFSLNDAKVYIQGVLASE